MIAAVPWEGHAELLSGLARELAGKIVVDCVNPLGFDQRGAYPLPVPEGSAAQQAAALLPGSRVVAAFHHVSAVLLLDPGVASLDQDVLVLGDDRAATDLVQALAARIPGARGVYAGRLRNSGQVEALTANLAGLAFAYVNTPLPCTVARGGAIIRKARAQARARGHQVCTAGLHFPASRAARPRPARKAGLSVPGEMPRIKPCSPVSAETVSPYVTWVYWWMRPEGRPRPRTRPAAPICEYI